MIAILWLASFVLAVLAAPAAAQGPVDRLLQELETTAPQARGEVSVLGWIERARDGRTQLVVSLTPSGNVKLVADPGIVVVPLRRNGLNWASGEPASRVLPHVDYFATAQELRLPFTAATSGAVEAEVEYAYCVVREQCLFGHARVSVPVGAQPAG